jgi:hypothetical protein
MCNVLEGRAGCLDPQWVRALGIGIANHRHTGQPKNRRTEGAPQSNSAITAAGASIMLTR